MKKLTMATILLASLTNLMGCANSNKENNANSQRAAYLKDSPTPYSVSDAERTKSVDELVILRRKMFALEGKLIAPAQEDLDQYADFLKEPNTGIARLFPRDAGNERRPLLVNGEGAYYQFLAQSNEYGRGSDIEYSTQNSPEFSVGFAGADFGFFGQVGKFDIRQLNDRDPVVAFAMSYPSPSGQSEPFWRSEQRKWSSGIVNGAVTFSDRTQAVVGMSYVVRSVSERGYEVVVIFQVVRRDPTDASLILAWKLLKQLDKPVVGRN